MTDQEKLNFLKEKISSSRTREELDIFFKEWRGRYLLPLREEIKSLFSPEEKKKLGLSFKFLMEKSQDMYQLKKDELSTWSSPFYEARKSIKKLVPQEIKYSSKNLLSLLIQDVFNFLLQNNFVFFEESEIVDISENFDLLLIPEGHPARETSDSFFLDGLKRKEKMLRTHTTTSSLKLLKEYKKEPFRGASLGSVYRKEDNNLTHLSQFTQLDLVWVEKKLSFEELRKLIESLLFSLLGESKEERKYRIRSSYFPFTSPSYEVDLSCSCKLKESCRLCKGTGWIEILGCGFFREEIVNRTHPGFTAIALGIGLERVVMIKHLISDIRTLYKNDFSNLIIEKRKD